MARALGSRTLGVAGFAFALAGVLIFFASAWPASAATQITVDTDALTVTGDPDNDAGAFNGVPFAASKAGGIATFRIKGDLDVGADDAVKVVGTNAASLIAGNNANIAEGATFDASAAAGTRPTAVPAAPAATIRASAYSARGPTATPGTGVASISTGAAPTGPRAATGAGTGAAMG